MDPSVWVITGAMASGKSTVADLLARRWRRGVHVRGDVFRRMIVAGQAEITPEMAPDAVAQLDLRAELGAAVASGYWREGFSVALQDVFLGPQLSKVVAGVEATPLYVVVLHPRPAVVAAREAGRSKTGYGTWTPEQLCAGLDADTPRIGHWLDNSEMTPDQTVDAILAEADAARIR